MMQDDSIYRVSSRYPSTAEYRVPIPGSSVTVALAHHLDEPERWSYSLWSEYDASGEFILAADSIIIPELRVNAEQVARIAFLLNCEYSNS